VHRGKKMASALQILTICGQTVPKRAQFHPVVGIRSNRFLGRAMPLSITQSSMPPGEPNSAARMSAGEQSGMDSGVLQ